MSQVNGDHRPPYQVFPDLSPEEFETLKRDIADRGVQVAIEIDARRRDSGWAPEGQGLSRTQDQELPTPDHQRAGRGREAAPRHQGELLEASVDTPSEEGVDRLRTQAKTKAVQSSAC